MSNPLFKELSFKQIVEGCGLQADTCPLLFALADRAVGTLTDAELDDISAELNNLVSTWICREGFDQFHLGWTKWIWTPDGYRPDPDGKASKWPLSPDLPLSHVVDLALHLHKSLPKA